MIYHEMFGQHLRLGNFLFKYAWSIAKREQFGEISCYPDYYLWKYLKYPPLIKMNESEHIPDSNFLKVNWEWSKEEMERVNKVIINGKSTIVSLDSFFQSEKWFENYRRDVVRALKFTDDAEINVIIKYKHLFESKKPTIGIGIRLGDFVGHGDFYQLPGSWYILALNEHFPNWKTENEVVIFSDDIEGAKRMFAGYEYDSFKYAEPNNTHTHADNFKHYHGDASEQLILGGLMDNFIIGNSTFSWWQAWLATYTSGKVIHSGKVFSETGNMKHINTEYYYPKNWIKYDP